MKLVFFLPAGVIEWPIPPELQLQFSFNNTATAFRINGFFLANDIYLRHDQIVGMCFYPDDATQAPQYRPPGMNLQ